MSQDDKNICEDCIVLPTVLKQSQDNFFAVVKLLQLALYVISFIALTDKGSELLLKFLK